MKHIYLTNTDDGSGGVAHAHRIEAIKYAELNPEVVTVEKCTLTKDAVIRLHNGGGGFIEKSEVIWTRG